MAVDTFFFNPPSSASWESGRQLTDSLLLSVRVPWCTRIPGGFSIWATHTASVGARESFLGGSDFESLGENPLLGESDFVLGGNVSVGRCKLSYTDSQSRSSRVKDLLCDKGSFIVLVLPSTA